MLYLQHRSVYCIICNMSKIFWNTRGQYYSVAGKQILLSDTPHMQNHIFVFQPSWKACKQFELFTCVFPPVLS